MQPYFVPQQQMALTQAYAAPFPFPEELAMQQLSELQLQQLGFGSWLKKAASKVKKGVSKAYHKVAPIAKKAIHVGSAVAGKVAPMLSGTKYGALASKAASGLSKADKVAQRAPNMQMLYMEPEQLYQVTPTWGDLQLQNMDYLY